METWFLNRVIGWDPTSAMVELLADTRDVAMVLRHVSMCVSICTMYMCVCMYMYMGIHVCCVFLRVVVCNGERILRRAKPVETVVEWRYWLTAGSLQRLLQDYWNFTAPSGKANDWRNRERAVFDLFSHLKMGKDPVVTFGEPLKHVIAPSGQILVSRIDDDLSCTPCVRS